MKDLTAFGQTLRHYRKVRGLSQEQLAEQLSKIGVTATTETELGVSGNLISKWERAYRDKRTGRQWEPTWAHTRGLIQILAPALTAESALVWAAQAGYQLTQKDLEPLFSLKPIRSMLDSLPQPDHQASLLRLPVLSKQPLFGVETLRSHLQQALTHLEGPPIIVLVGLGGSGKTALAYALAQQAWQETWFYDLAWVSAKQEDFVFQEGIVPLSRPALDERQLIDTLLGQLLPAATDLPAAPTERRLLLATLLQRPHLIVIDNLETMIDYQALLPALRSVAGGGKFLLTSRYTLAPQADVVSLPVPELSATAASEVIEYEFALRGRLPEANLSQSVLAQIYAVVGGNPLALKLVSGQLLTLPLAQVLTSLKEAQGKQASDLYTFIYWQSWHTLSDLSRHVLLSMPVVPAQGGHFEQLQQVTELDSPLLSEALQQLATLSLVEVGGDVANPVYRIHRLTETFLLHEVAQWQ